MVRKMKKDKLTLALVLKSQRRLMAVNGLNGHQTLSDIKSSYYLLTVDVESGRVRLDSCSVFRLARVLATVFHSDVADVDMGDDVAM